MKHDIFTEARARKVAGMKRLKEAFLKAHREGTLRTVTVKRK